MKDKKNLVMVIIIGITISLFFCFNTTVLATTGTVTTSDLRLRKEENTTSEILTLLNENDEVEIISENGDWYKVKSDGKVGFVSKKYIKVKDNNIVSNTENNVTETENKAEENKNDESNNSVENKSDETNSSEENKNSEQTAQNENAQVNKIQEGTTNSETQIRITPLINGDIINNAKSGEKYQVISNVGLWSYIKNNEKSGWVLTEKLSIQEVTAESTENKETNSSEENNNSNNNEENKTQEENKNTENKEEENKENESTEKKYSSSKTYYVKGTSVNARSKASKTSSVVKQLDTNQEIKVTGEDGEWYIVDLNGKKAYILKTLLSSKKVEVTSRSSTSLDENKATEQENDNKSEEKAPANNSSSSSSGEAVVAYAKQFLGYRYVYGTNGPNTFDCSGFVQYVYKHFGISLSRSSKTQANDGVAVSKNNLQPGDILIFKNTAKTQIGHVGIYIGNNQFIHASNSKTGVIISSLSTASYQQRYVTARRVL